jgi:hypothetical protein
MGDTLEHPPTTPRCPIGYFLVAPEMLTTAEVEALKRRAKERSAYFRKAFAHLRRTG